jgi:hypothetical protein
MREATQEESAPLAISNSNRASFDRVDRSEQLTGFHKTYSVDAGG